MWNISGSSQSIGRTNETLNTSARESTDPLTRDLEVGVRHGLGFNY